MGARPTIVRNPPRDRDFGAAIEAVLDKGVTDPAIAQEELRARYPRVIIRPRDLDAESTSVWYVYREGRWVPGD